MEGRPISQHRADVQDLLGVGVGFNIEIRNQGHGGVVPGLGYGKVTENEPNHYPSSHFVYFEYFVYFVKFVKVNLLP
jgi:hypothetical protein